MQLFAVTIEATAQRTITLAASSIAEAQATALDLFEFPADALDLQVVEATRLQGATA